MKKDSRTKKISIRSRREDGDVTKAKIMDAAGRLFAERGYENTTSKDICELAETNIAAVNYHFGSREGLYLEVLAHVHNNLIDLERLTEITNSQIAPELKLEKFLDSLVSPVFSGKSWHIRLWGRELVRPSGLTPPDCHKKAMQKFGLVAKIISEITGIPADANVMKFCILNVMSPCMVLLITSRKRETPHQEIFACDAATVASNLIEFTLGGLKAYAAKYAEKEALMTSLTPAT